MIFDPRALSRYDVLAGKLVCSNMADSSQEQAQGSLVRVKECRLNWLASKLCQRVRNVRNTGDSLARMVSSMLTAHAIPDTASDLEPKVR